MQLLCPTSLLVGETAACDAYIRSAAGQVSNVSLMATWSVTPDEVATYGGLGRVTGRAAGTATVRVSHEGRSATADVAVRAEDGLVVTIGTTQGSGRMGESAAIGFSGFYSVVSADIGTLTVVTRAADGRVLSTAARQVTRGAGSFGLTSTVTMQAGVGSVCGTAGLRIAGRDVEPTGPLARPICIDEVR